MISSTAPGRICLFGEHQDYLGLPVIAKAIDRHITITGSKRADSQIAVSMPDIGGFETFEIGQLTYTSERDYLKSCLVVLKKQGFTFSFGADVAIRSDIPINAGCSSSSALCVAWVKFLIELSENKRDVLDTDIAYWAYLAEVEEFGEPGGMMDHYASACGGTIYLASQPKIKLEKLPEIPGTFILGDSLEPKNTLGILGWVKGQMLENLRTIRQFVDFFDLSSIKQEELEPYSDYLKSDQFELLKANVIDRDLCQYTFQDLKNSELSPELLGKRLNEHHQNLRLYKKVSTPKIDRMAAAALKAGALGAKINGSGGGGCMFAYTLDHVPEIIEAIENEGGKAYIV